MHSPGFPNSYSNFGGCTINVSANNTQSIVVSHFSTEADFDLLTVNGMAYSGYEHPPEGIVPQGLITWHADHSYVAGLLLRNLI